jgi:SulP family sulfate permease
MTIKVLNRLPQSGPSRPNRLSAARGVGGAVVGLLHTLQLVHTLRRVLEDRLNEAVAQRPALKHVVLQCSAINDSDASALESLEAIDARLRDAGITLHLSEVKGPVMDRLQGTELLQHLRGQVFLTHYQAVQVLAPRGTPAA